MAQSAYKRSRSLPPQQPEHFLAILEGLCLANWIALVTILLVSGVLYFSDQFYWPQGGVFTTTFFLIATEFALSNLALSLALKFRSWYQLSPRQTLNRLAHLTLVVLIWDGIHVLGAFEAFGGLQGPIASLLPLLIAAGFMMLPNAQASVFGIGMLLATGLIVALQHHGVLYASGALGVNFQGQPGSLGLSLVILLVICAFAFALGLKVRERLNRDALGPSPGSLLDARFGCFSKSALLQRLADELVRRRKLGGESSLLMLRLEQIDKRVAESGLDGLEHQLAELHDCIQAHTRIQLDTCAYLGNACFAVLLPTASADVARRVQQRIGAAFIRAPASDPLAYGIATISDAQDYEDVFAWKTACMDALLDKQAHPQS